jgi:hypothetical protein
MTPTLEIWAVVGGFAARLTCDHGAVSTARYPGMSGPPTYEHTLADVQRAHAREYGCGCAAAVEPAPPVAAGPREEG